MSMQKALNSVCSIFNQTEGDVESAVDALMFDLILAYPIDKSLCRKIFFSSKDRSLSAAYNSVCKSKPIFEAREEYHDYRIGDISIHELRRISIELQKDSLVKNFIHIFKHYINQQLNEE